MTEAIAVLIGFVLVVVLGAAFWIGGAAIRSRGWVPPAETEAAPGERFGWEVDPDGGTEIGGTSETERRQGTMSTSP